MTPEDYTEDDRLDMWMWLHIERSGVHLRTSQCCQSDVHVDRGDGVAEPCKRPMWGDGYVDGKWYGMCSRCWHLWCTMHGHYTMLQANPAAAKIDETGIARLTFSDQPKLPAFDCTFPAEWTDAA